MKSNPDAAAGNPWANVHGPRRGKGGRHDGCPVLHVLRHRISGDDGHDRLCFPFDMEREEGEGSLESAG